MQCLTQLIKCAIKTERSCARTTIGKATNSRRWRALVCNPGTTLKRRCSSTSSQGSTPPRSAARIMRRALGSCRFTFCSNLRPGSHRQRLLEQPRLVSIPEKLISLMIINAMCDFDKPDTLISYVTDRLGHDRRYAIDSSFAQRELKWKPLHNFGDGLDSTVDWYANHRAWWQTLLERTG